MKARQRLRLGSQMINFNKLPQTVDGAAGRTVPGKSQGKGVLREGATTTVVRVCARVYRLCEYVRVYRAKCKLRGRCQDARQRWFCAPERNEPQNNRNSRIRLSISNSVKSGEKLEIFAVQSARPHFDWMACLCGSQLDLVYFTLDLVLNNR